jgi:hypothetical protein
MLIWTSTAFGGVGADLAVPPGYEIVKIEGNRVEVKDLTTGYITPYWTDFDKDTIDTPVITDTQDGTPREWYYFERVAVLPWYADAVGADLNHSGVGEIYGWAGGITYVDTISSGWNFDIISLGDLDSPRMAGDTDNDGNMELLTHGNDYLTLLESDSYYSYPTNIIWSYYHNTNGERDPKLGNLDGDGWGEIMYYPLFHLVYEVYEPDSTGAYQYKAGIRFGDYVNDYVGEPSYGDIDGDGFMEIFAGGIHGEVIVFENVADDSFEFVWQYQLGEPNAYRTEFLGDTDGDGLNEFMVSASSLFGGNGALFALFESRGDNSYEMVYSTVVPKYQLTDGDMLLGDFIVGGPHEIALCTGNNIVVLSAESDNGWHHKLRFRSSIRSSEFFYYQRIISETPVIINIIRPTWETYLLKIKDRYIPGDINNNNTVNGVDIVYLVRYIKQGGEIVEPIIRADANGDCQVNLLDVSYLIDYFKGRLPAPEPGWCHFYVE